MGSRGLSEGCTRLLNKFKSTMKNLHRVPSALLAITFLPAGAGPVDITYAPDPGTRWHKTFECSTMVEWDELNVVMAGQEVDSQFLPQIDLESRDTVHIEVIDELHQVRRGRPTLVHRTYGEVRREAEEDMEIVGMGGVETAGSQGEGRSPLEGRTVAFEWSDDGEDYSTTWVGREADDDLLEGLDGDLELLAWLPDDAVEVGDSWTLPASVIGGLLQPGGELSIELEGENVETFETKGDDEGSIDGELTLRLTDVKNSDGGRLAIVVVEGEATSQRSYPGDLKDVPVAEGTTTVTDEVEYELEGELSWDLGSGILRTLEITGETQIKSHAIKDDDQPGPAFESIATLIGEVTFSITVEPAD